MIKKIKFILLIPLLCYALFLLLNTEKVTKVEEITYLASGENNYGMFAGVRGLFFLTPDRGFSIMAVRKEKGEYPFGTLFRETNDGGKTWETLYISEEYLDGIAYLDGVLYTYYNKSSKNMTHINSHQSQILFSKDMGKTWNNLYTFDSNISNLHVFNAQNMSIVKRESESYYIYQSQNGGYSWSKATGVPYIINSMYVQRDGDKLYFSGYDNSIKSGETYIYDYDVVNQKLGKQNFNVDFIYAFYVSEGLLSMSIKGRNVKYFTFDGDKFKLISKINWGAWREGSVMAEPLAKDGKYVFTFISQFPGRNEMKSVLFFSETGGKKWKNVKVFKSGEGPVGEEYNIYRDDSIFQFSYVSMDSLKIFRIKK